MGSVILPCSLETPVISHTGLACVTFSVHMMGRDIDSLMLLTPSRGDSDPWLVLEGEKGNGWVSQQLEITLSDEKVGWHCSCEACQHFNIKSSY